LEGLFVGIGSAKQLNDGQRTSAFRLDKSTESLF